MMMRSICAALACLASVGVASAHHGIANFDLNTDIEITGTVREMAFINPHSWLHLDVAGADGRITAWRCELRGASVLRRSGWTPEMFLPGTRITITGAPDRFEPNTCYLGTALFADGTSIDRYGQISRPAPVPVDRPRRLSNGAPNISGDWAGEQRVLTDPRGMSGAFLPITVAETLEPGAVPEGAQAFPGARGTEVSLADDPIGAFWNRPSAMPLTEAGARAIDGFDASSTDNPRLRCETTNILFDWTFETDVNRITQQDDRIMLLYGTMGLERTIHMNLTEHPGDIEPSRAGHSIGRWEDDVLIVDTIGFEPGILSADGRVPHSDRLHVVERFSFDPDALALTRRYVATDPLYFEGEYTGADTVYAAEIPYQGGTCDDRSYRSPSDTGGGLLALSVWWIAAALAGAAVLLAATAAALRSRSRDPWA
jgi:hypothetical protein